MRNVLGGPAFAWAVLPIAFSPYGQGPLRGIGWRVELAYLPVSALLSAAALYRANNRSEAKQILEKLANQADELSAKRNYYLVELARNDNDEGRMKELLGRMRESTATSQWLQHALLTAGNTVSGRAVSGTATSPPRKAHDG